MTSQIGPASTSGAGGGVISGCNGGGAGNVISGSGIWAAIRAQQYSLLESSSRRQLLVYSLGLGMGIGVAGAGIYYIWTRNRGGSTTRTATTGGVNSSGKPRTLLDEAERRKAEGNEAYRQRRYEEAVRVFADTILLLNSAVSDGDDGGQLAIDEADPKREKWLDLVATCENNIAACHDMLNDHLQCIEHCTAAIRLKPGYAKALVRRAKCYQQLGQNTEALADYFELVSMENGIGGSPQQPQKHQQHDAHALQAEMDRVAEAVIRPELDAIFQNRVGLAQRIPQTLVAQWHSSSSVNDPLLHRAAALNEKSASEYTEGTLDHALWALKRCKYDDIASLAVPLAEDEQREPLERAQAVLLAARFLDYQGLQDRARALADQFGGLWERLEEAQKLAHKDLHVASIVLQMQLARPQTSELSISEEHPTLLPEACKQRLAQLAEEGLRVNPKNVDPLVLLSIILSESDQIGEALVTFQRAKKLDKEHPYIKFYEIYAQFLSALRQENMARIHNQIYEMDRALKEAERPPVFALIMLSKIAILLQNQAVALEAAKRAIVQQPNHSYAIFLSGMLDQQPTELNSPERFSQYMKRMELAMRKALEVDPNNWEAYRMLAKMRTDKHEFAEADGMFSQALDVARNREELLVLLKERLIVRMTQQRRARDKPVPRGMSAL